jgi:hypothetical protein
MLVSSQLPGIDTLWMLYELAYFYPFTGEVVVFKTIYEFF